MELPFYCRCSGPIRQRPRPNWFLVSDTAPLFHGSRPRDGRVASRLSLGQCETSRLKQPSKLSSPPLRHPRGDSPLLISSLSDVFSPILSGNTGGPRPFLSYLYTLCFVASLPPLLSIFLEPRPPPPTRGGYRREVSPVGQSGTRTAGLSESSGCQQEVGDFLECTPPPLYSGATTVRAVPLLFLSPSSLPVLL